MERIHLTLNFGHWDALALWGQWPDLLVLFVWEFVWWDVSVSWGQYLHHRNRDLQMPFIASKNVVILWRLWSSLSRTTLSFSDFALHCGLAITVVERLQRYNCIWLTYIDNVEQNVLFYIEVWSGEMLSLCGKLIWRWNAVFWLCFVFRRRLYRYLVWITSFLRS